MGDAEAEGDLPGFRLQMSVRWGDMDALGHVNNTRLFQYCESARIGYFGRVGLDDLRTKPTDGPGVVQAELRFRRQLKFPADVEIETHTVGVSQRSFTLAYTLRNLADGEVIAEGSSVCVWVDYEAGKALSLPSRLLDALRETERDPSLGRESGGAGDG